MRKVFIGGLAVFSLAGCQATPGPSLQASATFDPSEAAFINKPGTTKIDGHAFWRDEKGGTTNAAGEIIRLVPATAYARARFAELYRGGRSVPASQIQQGPADPQYAALTRTTRAESNGRFEFENVAPGEYFVAAQVRYKDKDSFVHLHSGAFHQFMRLGQDGGAMFETVTVTGKEEKAIKLVVTNDR